jgi:hypothetical protein
VQSDLSSPEELGLLHGRVAETGAKIRAMALDLTDIELETAARDGVRRVGGKRSG